MNLRNEAKRWLPKLGYLVYTGSLTWIIYHFFFNWHYDDPFITYRYAHNLALGLGFIYNPGEYILSTTSPFFAILLAFLSFLYSGDIPTTANFLGALSISLGGIFLLDLARTYKAASVGVAGLLLYPTSPLLLATLGSEIPLFLFFCLGAFAFYSRKNFILSVIFLALATLTRPDGLIVAAILLIDFLIRFPGQFPRRYFLLFTFFIAPWFLFAWSYYGSPLPATLLVKQNQAKMAISPDFASRLPEIFRFYYAPWQGIISVVLIAFGILYTLRINRSWIPVLIWPFIHWLAYSLLGVSGYFWYYAILIPGIIVALGLGLEAIGNISLYKGNHPIFKYRFSLIFSLLLLVSLFIGNIQNTLSILEQPDQRNKIYHSIGVWLNKNTPEDAKIAALEAGMIGFYAQRAMIDFAGLLHPQVSLQFSKETTYEDAAILVFDNHQPDYLVLQKGMFPQLENDYVFQNCHMEKHFLKETFNAPGTYEIFRCIYNE